MDSECSTVSGVATNRPETTDNDGAGDLHDQWLADTRRFWDADSLFQAKYRRICSDEQIDATTDERELQSLWDRRTRNELQLILAGIPWQSTWTCVEIGCGIGRLLKPIAQRVHKVIGVDISSRMVAFSQEYLAGVSNAEVHVNDGRSLGMIADGSIDFVFSHLAFQHMTLTEVVDANLAEIARILKPDGYCRIQCWREAPMPTWEWIKNWARLVVGRERYHGPRGWRWAPGRDVRFGGATFHPRQWNRRLRRLGLQPRKTEVGLGHDYWMWSTSQRRP